MELINKGEYMAWQLPKYTTIVLSTNPAGGDYSVTSLDPAQLSRFLSYKVEFEVSEWAKWAEGKLDDRVINFALLMDQELFHVTAEQEKKGIIPPANARNFTKFGSLLGGVKGDWETAATQVFILKLSKGCFLYDENSIVGRMFTEFIRNKWDKLPSPEEMLNSKWDDLKVKMIDCIYQNKELRPDMASTLTMRLCNYVLYLFSKKGGVKESTVLDRILDILLCDKKLFTDDLIFHLCRTLVSKYPERTKTIAANPVITKHLL